MKKIVVLHVNLSRVVIDVPTEYSGSVISRLVRVHPFDMEEVAHFTYYL